MTHEQSQEKVRTGEDRAEDEEGVQSRGRRWAAAHPDSQATGGRSCTEGEECCACPSARVCITARLNRPPGSGISPECLRGSTFIQPGRPCVCVCGGGRAGAQDLKEAQGSREGAPRARGRQAEGCYVKLSHGVCARAPGGGGARAGGDDARRRHRCRPVLLHAMMRRPLCLRKRAARRAEAGALDTELPLQASAQSSSPAGSRCLQPAPRAAQRMLRATSPSVYAGTSARIASERASERGRERERERKRERERASERASESEREREIKADARPALTS